MVENHKESAVLSSIILTNLGDWQSEQTQLSPLPAASSLFLWQSLLTGQSQLTASTARDREGITELKRRITLIFFNKGSNLGRV